MNNDAYKKLLQDYVNAPYEVLLNVAKNSLAKIMPAFNEIADDGNGAKFVLPFICTTLAVDGKFTQLEFKFVNDLLDANYGFDQFKGIVNSYYSSEWVQAVDNLIDACPSDLKESLLCFCLAFASVDEKIAKEEVSFISKLID